MVFIGLFGVGEFFFLVFNRLGKRGRFFVVSRFGVCGVMC